MNDNKRAIREGKRIIKKDGNRNRRRHLKRELNKNPDIAHETEYKFKHDSSAIYNKPKSKRK